MTPTQMDNAQKALARAIAIIRNCIRKRPEIPVRALIHTYGRNLPAKEYTQLCWIFEGINE